MTTLYPDAKASQNPQETAYNNCPLCGKPTLTQRFDQANLYVCPNCDIAISVPHNKNKLCKWLDLATSGNAAGLPGDTKTNGCISPPKYFRQNTFTFQFQSWDEIDHYLTRFTRSTGGRALEILGWRFKDSDYSHNDLYPVPVGAWIVVYWGAIYV